jgi:adenylate kinase
MTKAIIFTGTPGTGKSTLAKKLSLSFKKELISISDFAKEHSLFNKYNKKYQTYDININRLIKELQNELKKKKDIIFIDGHLSHYLPKKEVILCIVCKTELKELKKRLEKRKYNSKKINENLMCEIFEICQNEAIENKHNIKIIDCTNKNKKEFDFIKNTVKGYIKGHVL